jgi:hypothetical protein
MIYVDEILVTHWGSPFRNWGAALVPLTYETSVAWLVARFRSGPQGSRPADLFFALTLHGRRSCRGVVLNPATIDAETRTALDLPGLGLFVSGQFRKRVTCSAPIIQRSIGWVDPNLAGGNQPV